MVERADRLHKPVILPCSSGKGRLLVLLLRRTDPPW